MLAEYKTRTLKNNKPLKRV